MSVWIVKDMDDEAVESEIEVEADRISISPVDGSLCFDDGCGIFRVIADGWWTHVERKKTDGS